MNNILQSAKAIANRQQLNILDIPDTLATIHSSIQRRG